MVLGQPDLPVGDPRTAVGTGVTRGGPLAAGPDGYRRAEPPVTRRDERGEATIASDQNGYTSGCDRLADHVM